jgi:hypothetical protein
MAVQVEHGPIVGWVAPRAEAALMAEGSQLCGVLLRRMN